MYDQQFLFLWAIMFTFLVWAVVKNRQIIWLKRDFEALKKQVEAGKKDAPDGQRST